MWRWLPKRRGTFNMTLQPGQASETVDGECGPDRRRCRQAMPASDRRSTAKRFSGCRSLAPIRMSCCGLLPVFPVTAHAAGNGRRSFCRTARARADRTRGIFQTENQPQISADGQRVADNTTSIDGVSANSLTHGGAAVVTPNQEAVGQITVVSTSYDASLGRNTGAQIQGGDQERNESAAWVGVLPL